MGISVTDIFPADSSVTPQFSTSVHLAETPKLIDVTATMWLSVPTLGIYGLVIFYRVMKTYLRYSNANNSASSENLDTWFWLYISFAVVGGLIFPFGIPLTLISIVFGAMLLRKVIHKRNLAIEQLGGVDQFDGRRLYKSADWHIWMWGLGSILSFFILPIILLILQGIQFFKEYNIFVKSLDKQ